MWSSAKNHQLCAYMFTQMWLNLRKPTLWAHNYTEIHFLPVDESHTHALSRDTKHLRLGGQVYFFRWLFSDALKPRGCISWPVWLLRGINKTAWGPKLILTAGLAYLVSCAILGHLLMAQYCHFCLSICSSPPSASHPPPPPPTALPPAHSL